MKVTTEKTEGEWFICITKYTKQKSNEIKPYPTFRNNMKRATAYINSTLTKAMSGISSFKSKMQQTFQTRRKVKLLLKNSCLKLRLVPSLPLALVSQVSVQFQPPNAFASPASPVPASRPSLCLSLSPLLPCHSLPLPSHALISLSFLVLPSSLPFATLPSPLLFPPAPLLLLPHGFPYPRTPSPCFPVLAASPTLPSLTNPSAFPLPSPLPLPP